MATNLMKGLTEIQVEAIDTLPENLRTLLEGAVKKNVHTLRAQDFNGRFRALAKVGESGRIIVLQLQDGYGKWVQGSRPGIQLRPKSIEILKTHGGSLFTWL